MGNSTDAPRIETRLEFDVHRLEKGLSHQNLRLGFGKSVLREIGMRMTWLEKADVDYMHNSLYLEALSALHEYQTRHEEAGFDLTPIKALLPLHIWDGALSYQADDEHHAGSFVMQASCKSDNFDKGFVDLAEGRYSVREYSDEPVVCCRNEDTIRLQSSSKPHPSDLRSHGHRKGSEDSRRLHRL